MFIIFVNYHHLISVPFFSFHLSLFFSLSFSLTLAFQRSEGRGLPQATRISDGSRGVVLTVVAMACVCVVVLVALAIACLRHHASQLEAGKLGLGPEAGTETHFDYQVGQNLIRWIFSFKGNL